MNPSDLKRFIIKSKAQSVECSCQKAESTADDGDIEKSFAEVIEMVSGTLYFSPSQSVIMYLFIITL